MVTASSSLELVLPDGSRRAVEAGTTALDVARGIGPRLAKDAVGALRVRRHEQTWNVASWAAKDFCSCL